MNGGRAPDRHEVAAAETRQYGRSAGLLTIALGTAGLLAYAFFAVSSHTLDKHRLRDDRRPLVGQLHRRGDPVPADRAAALADPRRARGGGRGLRARAADRGPDPGRGDALARRRACWPSAGRSPTTCSTGRRRCTGCWSSGSPASAPPTTPAASSPGGASSGSTRPLLVLEGGSRLMFPVAVAVGIAEGIDAVALGIAVAPLACLTVLPFAFAAPPRRSGQAPGARRRRAWSSRWRAAAPSPRRCC